MLLGLAKFVSLQRFNSIALIIEEVEQKMNYLSLPSKALEEV